MKRGEIWYINRGEQAETGEEMRAGRPGIVIATPCGGRLVTVIYLTTNPRYDLPSHVSISSSSRPCVALCEQITTVDASRVGMYVGTCSDREMKMIDLALLVALGIDIEGGAARTPQTPPNREEIVKLTTERDLYKSLYEKLLAELVE